MENTTLSPPLCSKHGCEKVWHKDPSKKNGGRWACNPCKYKWPAGKGDYTRTKKRAAPICEKHGCKKYWKKNSNIKAGGAWRCRPCQNKWPSEQAERVRAKDKAPPMCSKHGCEKVWRGDSWDCRKCAAESARQFRKANPGSGHAGELRRRALKRNASSPLCTVTAKAIAERFALTDGCAYCGADAKLTADHVVPLNDGGLHVPSNLVGACHSCNSSKQDSPVEAWFKAQSFFSEQRWQRIQKITGQGQLSLI